MSTISKRILCGLLALLILTCLFPATLEAAAQTDLVYLFINDTLIQSLTASNMPLRINNSMYISYRHLNRIKPLKYFYDEDIRILKVYTSDGSLIFDISNSITYDQDGRIYSYLAAVRGGVLFVPIEFICRFFGVSYDQFSSEFGPVIRINSTLSLRDDDELIAANRENMQILYNDFYPAPYEPVTPQPVEPPVEEDPQEDIRPRTIYTMVCGPLNEYSSALLSALDSYHMPTAFFLTAEGLQTQGDQLRRLVSSGHSLGLYVSAADPVGEAEALNALLSSMIFRKTRLVCIREGSKALTQAQREALTAAGYRIWDGMMDPGTGNRSGYTVSVNGKNLLQNAAGYSTLLLRPTEAARDSIYTLLRYMRENQISTAAIGEWTTPVNQIKYYY